jgi:hypothetical protein
LLKTGILITQSKSNEQAKKKNNKREGKKAEIKSEQCE